MMVQIVRKFFYRSIKRQVTACKKYLSILHPQVIANRIWLVCLQYLKSNTIKTETRHTLLKNLVLSDCPQIGEREISDFDRVSFLRQWAARATNWSNKEGLLDHPSTNNPYARGFNFYSQDAPTIYAAFMGGKGGVWCSGTAYALLRLYELFGYKAFRIGIGVPNSDATHIVTLVEIDHEARGRKILSVQDAYFDSTYVHTDGRPMDYFELLELLRLHHDGDVVIVSSSIPMIRDLLYFDNEHVKKIDGFYSIENFEEQFQTELNSFYEEKGFPQNILYIHLSVLSVYDLHRVERKEFISKLSREGVWKR